MTHEGRAAGPRGSETVEEPPEAPVAALAEDRDLVTALVEAQRAGFLGSGAVDRHLAHAGSLVIELRRAGQGRLVDLGSGGGVPGLVVARACPQLGVTLVERRGKRADFLSRIVKRWRMLDRVDVRAVDVVAVAEAVRGGAVLPFDIATARSFGAPLLTAALAAPLVRAEGRLFVSDPPGGHQWDVDALAALGWLVRNSPVRGWSMLVRLDGLSS